MDVNGRDRDPGVGRANIRAVAIERRMGNRYFGWSEPDHERDFADHALARGSQGNEGCGHGCNPPRRVDSGC